MSEQGFTVWVTGPEPRDVDDVVSLLVGNLTGRQLTVETIDARTPGVSGLDDAIAGAAVVLARYMQILTPRLIDRYPFRIVNIHPSLLPYHPGSNAYKQAWEEGVRVSGCTAHFVTEQLDAGPVVLQDVFHIRVGEDALEDVKARGRALEGKVLSQAVQLFLNDQLVVKDKKVIFRPGRFQGATAAS